MTAPGARSVRAVVTEGRDPTPAIEASARRIAVELGVAYVPRSGRSLEAIRREAGNGEEAAAVLAVTREGLALHLETGAFSYHPGMGVNRIRQLRQGRPDWMVEAMDLRAGDRVLDATLGLGSDLLVASFVVGPEGRATGLESEPLLALIVREGMRTYVHPVREVTEALRRIEVVVADHRAYLEGLPRGSYDIVYFDPMFTRPVEASRHMIPIRRLANPGALDRAVLEAAAAVARRRVVVKDRSDGPYVQSGWFDRVIGGERSRVAYAILEAGERL